MVVCFVSSLTTVPSLEMAAGRPQLIPLPGGGIMISIGARRQGTYQIELSREDCEAIAALRAENQGQSQC